MQHTNSQYNLPAIGTKIASKAHREGVAERFADPAVQKSIEVDLALITYYDALLRDVERTIVNTARHHDANTLHLLHTVPGIGTILSLVLLYDIHDVHRFPRVQDFVSYVPPGHMCQGIRRETVRRRALAAVYRAGEGQEAAGRERRPDARRLLG